MAVIPLAVYRTTVLGIFYASVLNSVGASYNCQNRIYIGPTLQYDVRPKVSESNGTQYPIFA